MTAEVAKEKGYRVPTGAAALQAPGFEVTDEDGHKSWCPLTVFYKHHSVVLNETLAKTCEDMVSLNYQERFKAEYIQLKNRYDGLMKMLSAWDDGKLNFKPTCPRDLYSEQSTDMELYLRVLERRAELEGIDLSDVK